MSKIISEVLARLSQPFVVGDHFLHLGASAGIAMAPMHGSDFDELLSNADLALYLAKKGGGRAYKYFTPSLRVSAQSRRALAKEGCTRPSPTGSSSSTISRRSDSPMAPSLGLKLYCVGIIPSAACSSRMRSTRYCRTARWQSTLGGGCSRPHAPRRQNGGATDFAFRASPSTYFRGRYAIPR